MNLKKKISQYSERLTVYVTKEVADIYRQGKYNNWDVADLGRSGFSESLLKNKSQLLQSAKNADTSDSVIAN
jgi:hypothetical protein